MQDLLRSGILVVITGSSLDEVGYIPLENVALLSY